MCRFTSSLIKPSIFLLLSIHISMSFAALPSPKTIEDALLRLKQSINNSTLLLSSWDASQAACVGRVNNWVGVTCSRGGSIYGIRLENMGLSGRIDVDALSVLPRLRSISFMYNDFGGPLPDISRLSVLQAVYLSNNKFEGPIDPNKFDGLNRLKKVHLANNNFTGEIPPSLANLPNLVELRLEGNRFEGSIPDFHQKAFDDLSLANNELDGPIPDSLSSIPEDAFSGNKGLCGIPLQPCKFLPPNSKFTPDPLPIPVPNKRSIAIGPMIIGASVVVLVVLLAIAMIIRKRNPKKGNKARNGQSGGPAPKNPNRSNRDLEKGKSTVIKHNNSTCSRKGEPGGKLCFMRDGEERFELHDLLKSSAEILGSGCFGSSYKTSLGGGSEGSPSLMMVVKRFKQMNNVVKQEFQEHMRRLGRLQHHNLLSLVAYYYRKDEKLLVSNYVSQGSLAFHLHGSQRGQLTLDWPTRLKVIKGVARGLSYLYRELPSLTAPHGHLKSTNVLLDGSFNPSLNDYGLIPLINQESSPQLMMAYKSPEYVQDGRICKKTDVWTLGILMIEIITGEYPPDYFQQGSSHVDLSSWVKEVVGDVDELGTQVFDKNMGSTKNCEGDILKTLRIALLCCESDLEKRLDIKDACEMIEDLKEKDVQSEDDYYSSYASDGEKVASPRMSDEYTIVPTS